MSEQVIQLITPEAHRVFQRNSKDEANIPISFRLAAPVNGAVQARLTALDDAGPIKQPGTDWQMAGMLSGIDFAGTYTDAPVGLFQLHIRVIDRNEQVVATASIEPVLVGDLWILAGQSNMEGCGKLTDIDEPQLGVSCFYMGDKWGLATDPLIWLTESLDPVNWTVPAEQREQAAQQFRKERRQGAGLGIAFGKEIMRYTDVPIGLIACAHGGTSMTQWDPSLRDQEGNSLYGAMLRKIRKLGGKVKGCLWYQGESDAFEKDAPLYTDRMRNLIASLRMDVNDPELPFIYAQLSLLYGMGEVFTHWDDIQHQQLELENAILHTAMVPTIDANLSDLIHLDGPSLRQVGKRMAWRALSMAYHVHVCDSGPRLSRFEWNADRTRLTIVFSGSNGRLEAVRPVYGFTLDTESHTYHPEVRLSPDGTAAELLFEASIPESSSLFYGKGINPTVNLRDERGIPLPPFGPVIV